MMWYRYTPDDGAPALISELTTPVLEDLLASDLVIHDSGDAPGCGLEDIREQLRIELLARSLNL